MSLLNRGTETVAVFADVTKTDADGNTITAPGSVGVVCRAVVQPVTVVGANAEKQDGGFHTSSKYRHRLVG